MKPELLTPVSLAWLGLLVPLVILYILKVKRKRLVVPSTWLWASAQRDLLAKAPFRKLIAQLSLVLQALALILLAIALAGPVTRGDEIQGGRIAIVIDVSASMSTVEPAAPDAAKATRLDRARDAALEMVKSLPPGTEAMVVEAGRDARIVTPLDRDVRRIETAITTLQSQDVEGDLGAAVALAVDRLKTYSSARVVVITDGNLARPPSLENAAVPIEVVTVGTPMANAAIVRTDVRSAVDSKTDVEEVQAFLLVANYGTASREVYATIHFEGDEDILASRRFTLGPGEKSPVVLSFRAESGDYGRGLVFDISPHDAMAVDDVAYGRVPAGDRLPVVVVGPDTAKLSPWILRALASDAGLAPVKATVADLGKLKDLDPGALLVFDGACVNDPPGGDVLVIHPPPGDCFGTKVGATLEKPSVTSWETGDGRFRFLTLDGVSIAKANKLEVESATRGLVRAQDGVLIADVSTPSRMATLVGFDVGDSDWPLKSSFVLFMRNVTDLARAHRASGVVGALECGGPLRVNVPPGTEGATVTAPDGTKLESSERDGLVVVPAVRKVGLYHVALEKPKPRDIVVPVNLTSVAESDITKKSDIQSGGAVTVHDAGKGPERYREYAWMLGLAALALFVGEVFWFTRRPKKAESATPVLPRAPERRRT